MLTDRLMRGVHLELLRQESRDVGIVPRPGGYDGYAVGKAQEFLLELRAQVCVPHGAQDGLDHQLHGLNGIFDVGGLVPEVGNADDDRGSVGGAHLGEEGDSIGVRTVETQIKVTKKKSQEENGVLSEVGDIRR